MALEKKQNVVVANTFVLARDVDSYINQLHTIATSIKIFCMKTSFRNIHNVPFNIIERFRSTFENYPNEIIIDFNNIHTYYPTNIQNIDAITNMSLEYYIQNNLGNDDHRLNDYKTILQNATNITNKSKYTYTHILTQLVSKMGKNMVDILNNPEEAKNKIITEYDNIRTQNTFFTTVIAFFKHANIKDTHPELYNQWYYNSRMVYNQLVDLENNHVSTIRQDEGIIPWYDIIQKRDSLPIGSMSHLLLSMYTWLTRRQIDFYKVYLYLDQDDIIDDSITYINMAVPKPYIHITVGKTIKHTKDGYFRDVLDDIVLNSLNLSLIKTPRNYLFVNSNKQPYNNSNTYMKWSNNKLKSLFANRHMSVNMLRHSHSNYINNIPNITWSQRTMYAQKMGHSVDMQIKYNVSTFTHNDFKNKLVDDEEDTEFKRYILNKVCSKITS
jgi:hypothetical protein